jgi:hypothetical protein
MHIFLDLVVETKDIPFPKLWSLEIPDQYANRFCMLCPHLISKLSLVFTYVRECWLPSLFLQGHYHILEPNPMNSSNPRFHANLHHQITLIEDQDFNMRIVGNKVIQSWIHNTIPRRMFLLPAELEVLCLALPESPASLIIGPTLLWGWRLGLEFYKRNNLHQFFGVHLLGSSAHDRVGTHLIMKLAQLFWMSQKRVRMDNPLSVQESYSVTTWTSLSPFSFCCYKTLPYKNKENKLTNTWYSNKQNPSSRREAT